MLQLALANVLSSVSCDLPSQPEIQIVRQKLSSRMYQVALLCTSGRKTELKKWETGIDLRMWRIEPALPLRRKLPFGHQISSLSLPCCWCLLSESNPYWNGCAINTKSHQFCASTSRTPPLASSLLPKAEAESNLVVLFPKESWNSRSFVQYREFRAYNGNSYFRTILQISLDFFL